MTDLTIQDAARKIAARELRATDLTSACLEQIASRDNELNAFITVLGARAMAEAEAADREIAAGRHRGPLHGIPISIKDLIDLEGVPTTAASRVRAGHVAASDAPVAARLRAAGAIVVGKCNLHEFAFGTTNEDSAYGPSRNPHDPSRSPGGSSGGSAAAVVAGMCLASVGTDTGGSIRIPAAACGIVGLKPTRGEIPCAGVVPLSWTFDHVGPLARSVADAWILYDVMRGGPVTSRAIDDSGRALRRGSAQASSPPTANLAGARLAILDGYFQELLEEGVREQFGAALDRLRSGGAEVTRVRIAHASLIAPVYLHTVLPEAASYHAPTLESQFDRYTRPVALRIQMGRYVLAEDYVRAKRGRRLLGDEVDGCLDGQSALILPTLPITAPKLGAVTVDFGSVRESVRHVMLRLTQLFNITKHPAVTLPCGRATPPSGDVSLPVGLQIVGRRGDTAGLLRLAAVIESCL